MTRAPCLMIQGTASGVGKSLLVTALCRIFSREGLSVAPFKAQNMSNNAAVTLRGGEMGRAQALQAQAAGLDPVEEMNPVLLKPLGDQRSEVVVLGRGRPELARTPWRERKRVLEPVVLQALESLRSRHDLVVVEGAGSPAEINLREGDVVNMGLARAAGIPVLLVADIDRGGAFAALYGTWALLEEEDRRHLRGFVLNRFRGDPALLHPAPRSLEERTGLPTLGVVPYVEHLLPEEDAAVLDRGRGGPDPEKSPPWELRDRHQGGKPAFPEESGDAELWIGAIHLPHVSNFDDLDPLKSERGVRVFWVRRPDEAVHVHAIVIPGSRNTLADLGWLHHTGLAEALRRAAGRGVPVVGLCGGFQMLGVEVSDPSNVESGGREKGLGLLSVRTEHLREKSTARSRGRILPGSHLFEGLKGHIVMGYEIHHGRTGPVPEKSLPVDLRAPEVDWIGSEGRPLGRARGQVWGTYLHGIFTDDRVRDHWLREVAGVVRLGGPTPSGDTSHTEARDGSDRLPPSAGWHRRLEAEIDRVADKVAEGLDPDRLLHLARDGAP